MKNCGRTSRAKMSMLLMQNCVPSSDQQKYSLEEWMPLASSYICGAR